VTAKIRLQREDIATPAASHSQWPDTTSTCLYSSHCNFHLTSTCRFFLSETDSKVYARGSHWQNSEKSGCDSWWRENHWKKDDQPDKWRLCQGKGASSPVLTSRWKPINCLPWSTSNCTWTRKLESTNRSRTGSKTGHALSNVRY